MLSYFKSQQPATVLFFILVFIILKIPFFFAGNLMPIANVLNLWSSIGLLLDGSFVLNVLLAQVCLFLQSIWFNYLFHKADYHEGSSMIPALYYSLITTLIPQFNTFSIYILLVFILLALFQIFLLITIKESAKIECFNAGFMAGFLVVFNIHFIVFIPFLFLILYAIKPFRFNEYLMLLFGILFPLYMSAGISYISDIPLNANIFSSENYSIFRFHKNSFNTINFILTATYILFSFVSLRGIMYSTGFKRRKNLNMLIFFFIGMVITITFSSHLDETVFSMLFIPVSTFLTLFMLRIRKKRLGEILNVIFVLVTFITNIVRIFK